MFCPGRLPHYCLLLLLPRRPVTLHWPLILCDIDCLPTCSFSGVFLSSSLSPRSLILASLSMTVLSSLLLVTTADTHLELLYLGTGATGYLVSLQFASGV